MSRVKDGKGGDDGNEQHDEKKDQHKGGKN